MRTDVLLVLLGCYAVMSIVSFVMYGIDKRRAVKGRVRIPEATLLWIDLAFGFPGGFVGQRVFRHKTAKRAYVVRYWLVVLLHAAGWGLAAYLVATGD